MGAWGLVSLCFFVFVNVCLYCFLRIGVTDMILYFLGAGEVHWSSR